MPDSCLPVVAMDQPALPGSAHSSTLLLLEICLGSPIKKRMGATNVGVRRAHPYSWSLSSPQQPLETEDSPTVSLAPQYTSQRACRARMFSCANGEQLICRDFDNP